MKTMQKRHNIIHAALVIISTMLILTAGAVCNDTNVYAGSGDKAINETVPMSEAAFSYLDEIYTKRFPKLALEPQYGSYKDIEELRAKAAEITANCSTDKEKTEAVIEWVSNYITYDDAYTYCCYPIDVYHHRVGACLAYATLSQELLRLSGVPAVVGDGFYGDMENLTFSQMTDGLGVYGHAWIYVYYDNKWHMFDPLRGGSNELKDRSSIGRNYACTCIEGVMPYYEGMDIDKVACGYSAIILKDGHFMFYDTNGYGNVGTNFHFVNGMICYRSDVKSSGMYYLNQPGKFEKMLKDECYYGGWMEDNRGYAMDNGIFKAATIAELEGNPYILDTQGFATKVSREFADNCTLELGVPMFEVGDTFQFRPEWCDTEQKDGRVIVYEWYDKDHEPDLGYDGKVEVDKNGNITMLSPGLASVNVTSRESYDDKGCFSNNTFSVYIRKDFADCSIELEPVSDQKHTGEPVTPDVKLVADGTELVKFRDYVLDYSDNTETGTAKIRITGVGSYKGSIDTGFNIIDDPAEETANPDTGQSGNDSSEVENPNETETETETEIVKKAQPMKIKGKTLKIKAKTIKKKSQTYSIGKAIDFIKKAKGTKTYKITKVSKSKYKKYFKINSKTGKITIKKGLKKGTYKITIKVSASGNDYYLAGSRNATVKVVVK